MWFRIKTTFTQPRADVEDDNTLWLLGLHLQRTERNEESLTWREVYQLYTRMTEPHDLVKLGSTPQSNTLLMEGGQVGALW